MDHRPSVLRKQQNNDVTVPEPYRDGNVAQAVFLNPFECRLERVSEIMAPSLKI
jgi:hypothetical protein